MPPIGRMLAQVGGCAALMVAAVPAQAGAQTLVDSAAALGAGQFAWGALPAKPGPVKIVVSIPLQQLFVYRGAALIAVSTVSTGSRGHDTPTGAFTILQKDLNHHSNKYDDAPMPFMQRLTWDGVAIHAGHNPGYPASHGCIRVPMAFARRLYAMTTTGARVVVTDDDAAPGLPADYGADVAVAKASARAAAIDPETAATRSANLATAPAAPAPTVDATAVTGTPAPALATP